MLRRSGFRTEAVLPLRAPIEGMDVRMPPGVLPAEAVEFIRQDPDAEYFQLLFKAVPGRASASIPAQAAPHASPAVV
jgi:hypothetical protein